MLQYLDQNVKLTLLSNEEKSGMEDLYVPEFHEKVRNFVGALNYFCQLVLLQSSFWAT